MQRLYHVVTIPDGITDVKLAQLRTATAVHWHASVGTQPAAAGRNRPVGRRPQSDAHTTARLSRAGRVDQELPDTVPVMWCTLL